MDKQYYERMIQGLLRTARSCRDAAVVFEGLRSDEPYYAERAQEHRDNERVYMDMANRATQRMLSK